MKLYLLLDMVVLAVPLLMSFESRIRFYRKWPYLGPSILLTGLMFLVWDILATARGDWGFNPQYLLGVGWAGIPLEEILFFIVVPYSCLFIYEGVCAFRRDRFWNIPDFVFYAAVVLLIAGALKSHGRNYSSTVLALCALSVLTTVVVKPGILRSQNYWLFIAITFVPFFLVNATLTGAPVVTYSPAAIWGKRITTIPLEDFFYSYALVSINFLLYAYFQGLALQRQAIKNLAKELSQKRSML